VAGRWSMADRTGSAWPVVGQLAEGAGKPKLLRDRGIELPDGSWARRLPQEATVQGVRPVFKFYLADEVETTATHREPFAI
jgi:hypothetical protein